MPALSDPLEEVRGTLDGLRARGDGAEALVEPGARYTSADPVAVRIRRRGRRLDLDDRGAAVALAGRPPGWLELAERVVASDGMNVNRRGVVFVPAVEGGRIDVARLAVRLAETSAAVHAALLDAEED